ncbi:MAG TPA: MBL fold metallo-hydrolase [Candidatus Hydrogenedentes bacterium]|nr:MBL fold metallo-hydrolase [Candidatus Hydrogenedentota bacterium]HNT88333.1 MBL fold metallo-hydrolase [Candidatus Hydrogenedentota bacterium]
MSGSPSITFTVLGGGGEVGATCYRVSVDGCQILLDCGTHPKKEGKDALPALELLRRPPDALIVSHAHVDHIGAIPCLLREFPLTKAVATQPTVRIMDRMLHNSVAVMETLAREKGIREYPLYDHGDVHYAMRCIKGFSMDTPIDLATDPPVQVSFHHAGHVLGSASILLRMPGHTLFYTADICECDQELMGGHTLLDHRLDVDTLVIECTRGATDESHIKCYNEEVNRLADAIDETLRRGGCVLLPCFALGRTQEMLNIVSRLQEEGRIPSVPIFASGLGRAVYEIYDRFDHFLRHDAYLRPLDLFDRVGNVWDPARIDHLLERPCIIIATSGMMVETTPSAMIAREMVKETRHGIFFVGYLDHETLGYKLLHAKPGDFIHFALGYAPVEVVLEYIRRFDFSAHAPRRALQNIIDHFHPRNIIFIHGDPEAIAWMRENTSNGAARFAPLAGDTVELEA